MVLNIAPSLRGTLSDAHLDSLLTARAGKWWEFIVLLMEEIQRSPVEVGSLSRYLLGFLHPRWWSPDFWTINSMVSSCLSSSECWISTENLPWKTGAGNIAGMFFQLFKESANFCKDGSFHKRFVLVLTSFFSFLGASSVFYWSL